MTRVSGYKVLLYSISTNPNEALKRDIANTCVRTRQQPIVQCFQEFMSRRPRNAGRGLTRDCGQSDPEWLRFPSRI